MTSLTTAKFILFIALCLGPKDMTSSIMVHSTPNTLIWTHQTAGGWSLVEKGLPEGGWPAGGENFSTTDLYDIGKENLKSAHAIRHHDWNHNSVLILDNGDRIEKKGAKAFYITNAGSPYEKVYTILYIEDNVPQ